MCSTVVVSHSDRRGGAVDASDVGHDPRKSPRPRTPWLAPLPRALDLADLGPSDPLLDCSMRDRQRDVRSRLVTAKLGLKAVS